MKKTIIWVLIGIAVLGGFFWIYKTQFAGGRPVTPTDMAQSKLPETLKALPEGFPLETLNITEQEEIKDRAHKSSLYSVVYTSSKSSSEILTLYRSYLAGNGYATTTVSTSTTSTYLVTKKGNDEITISISPSNSGTSVSISAVTRE